MMHLIGNLMKVWKKKENDQGSFEGVEVFHHYTKVVENV